MRDGKELLFKNIGCPCTESLKIIMQLQQAARKTNSMPGIIASGVECTSQAFMLQLYMPLLRIHLEYCKVVLSLYLMKNILVEEGMQWINDCRTK